MPLLKAGSADIVSMEEVHDSGISEFIKEELAQSDRPELTAADVIISGEENAKWRKFFFA